MPEPFNYMQGFKQPDLAGDFLKGMQIGEMSRQNELVAQQRQQAFLMAEQKRKEQEDMQSEILKESENPTLEGMRRLAMKHTALAEPYKKIMDSMTEEQKSNLKGQAWSVFSAIEQGNKPAAIDILKKIEAGARNSGQTGHADGAKLQRELLEKEETGEMGDKAVLLGAGTFLASVDPDNYAKYMEERRKQGKAPSELKESEAKAQSAAIKTKYAESEAAMDLEKKGWDITKIQEDVKIAKENARIAAINAQISRETNALKREELGVKVEESRIKRDEHLRERAAEAESALTTIDQSNEIITDLLSDQDTLKAITGASSYRGSIPGTKGKAMAGKIEQLQNTIASANLDKLKGAMSDKDIVFLKNIATSLDRSQDEASFLKELKRIQKSLTDSRGRVQKKYGAPAQGSASEPQTTNRNVTVDY